MREMLGGQVKKEQREGGRNGGVGRASGGV